MRSGLIICSNGETYTSRLLQVKKVLPHIPWIRIIFECSATISINNERSMLLEHSEKRGAPWTTIEPDEDGVIFWVVLRLDEDVMKILGRGHRKVSGPGVLFDANISSVVGFL